MRDANPRSVPQANVNGRVLSQCNLDELKKEMEMNFGDWQLFRGMVRPVIRPSHMTPLCRVTLASGPGPPGPPMGQENEQQPDCRSPDAGRHNNPLTEPICSTNNQPPSFQGPSPTRFIS